MKAMQRIAELEKRAKEADRVGPGMAAFSTEGGLFILTAFQKMREIAIRLSVRENNTTEAIDEIFESAMEQAGAGKP